MSLLGGIFRKVGAPAALLGLAATFGAFTANAQTTQPVKYTPTDNTERAPAKIDLFDFSDKKAIIGDVRLANDAVGNKINVSVPADISPENYKQMEEALLLLEQEGKYDFSIYKMPKDYIPFAKDKERFAGVNLSNISHITYKGGFLGFVPIKQTLENDSPATSISNYIEPRKAQADELLKQRTASQTQIAGIAPAKLER